MNPLEQIVRQSQNLAPCRVVGIDLGTTNCTVAQVELPVAADADPESACTCLSIEQETQSGSFALRLVPSVLAIGRGPGEIRN
ncbi:MAG: hypothetical protein NTW21_43305 [Verrucomicrobia bacterium]|nr:hypothetical protein [Verrucomicrobiota bacterium]